MTQPPLPTPHNPPHNLWLVINTQTHREALALEHLARQGFAAYCPLIAKRIKHARRTIDTKRPLFPGYVFVGHQPDLAWRSILGTTGVRSLIRTGDTPSLLDGAFIASLKAREVDGVIGRPEAPFQVGQQVAIRSGAFEGVLAEILELRDNDRIVLLLDILQKSTRVHLAASQLDPLRKQV